MQFLPGWFRDTLPGAPIERLAVMRLDRDMYESTMDALTALYPKLSPGGYAIVDDYGEIASCDAAVHDYLDAQGHAPRIVVVVLQVAIEVDRAHVAALGQCADLGRRGQRARDRQGLHGHAGVDAE